ncbi:MAG: hypothetical protein EB072_03890 [Betaproteobacteria bacterium]|nr:hypothetical protein [Betaproteobacteria bacterium]
MRIMRVRLKDFRGVSKLEVPFSPNGVTLIYGPNEAGKSTLMNAIDVLFDYLDDSRKEEVRNTKSVSRDVGAEVEADIDIGDYRFTYFKRFNKDRETVLTIYSPKAENLSGREAHDRVQKILGSSVDVNLWKALRILQGRSSEMPALRDQRALSEALDRAAGQVKAGERENALLNEAFKEYANYFTDTGREKEDPLIKARSKAAEAISEEQRIQYDLDALEEDINRHAALEKLLNALKRGLSGLKAAKVTAQETWERVSRIAQDLERACSAKQLTEQAQQSAQAALQTRIALISEVTATESRVREAKFEFEETTVRLNEASSALGRATTALEEATTVAARFDAEESIRRADLEFRNEEFELVRMKERFDHVATADNAAVQADVAVSTAKITDQLRTNIRDAEIELKTKKGILNSASPQLSITALESVSLILGDDLLSLERGKTKTVTVREPVLVTIGSQVKVRIEPGTGADDPKQAVLNAESALRKLCAQAGVLGPEEAESAWSLLVDAKRILADRDRVAREHLRDLTRDELAMRIQISRAKIDAYTAQRSSEIALLATPEECSESLSIAKEQATTARAIRAHAETVVIETKEHYSNCRVQHALSSAKIEREQQDLKNARDRLIQARSFASDDVIEEGVKVANAKATASLIAFTEAEGRTEGTDSESAKSFFEAAAAAFENANDQCAEQERQLISLRTRLELKGNEGLAEALAEAKRKTFEFTDSLARLERRAYAAKLLYETLNEERKAMRRAYVAPLRDGIERLGRHVFGPTFSVDVDEGLEVVSRTVNGITVSVKQLSTGAQEQLGLVTRLAAASMVSKDGGVPLVLDDALGSSDETRLEAMGAILRVASRDFQTIILTCAPERYAHVGASSSISITRQLETI